MKKVWYTFILFFIVQKTHAQLSHIEFQVKHFTNIVYEKTPNLGYNGNAIGATAYFNWKQKYLIEAGTELGFVSWGSQWLVTVGIHQKIVTQKQWQHLLGIQLHQGIVLFRPTPFYTWGTGIQYSVYYQTQKRSAFGLSAGLRYYVCPNYGDYSLINNYIDMPLQFHWRISLAK